MGVKNKLLLKLKGKTLLEWCLKPFQSSFKINEIVLTAPSKNEIKLYQSLVNKKNFSKVKLIIKGGSTRRKSTYLGLKAIKKTDFAVIHDAARPFLSKKLLEKVIKFAILHKAAILAVKAKDTLKKVSKDNVIKATVPREDIYLAQTPQVFKYDLILKAHKKAAADLEFTDDAMLVENLKEKVYIVEGSTENIKITAPEDLKGVKGVRY